MKIFKNRMLLLLLCVMNGAALVPVLAVEKTVHGEQTDEGAKNLPSTDEHTDEEAKNLPSPEEDQGTKGMTSPDELDRVFGEIDAHETDQHPSDVEEQQKSTRTQQDDEDRILQFQTNNPSLMTKVEDLPSNEEKLKFITDYEAQNPPKSQPSALTQKLGQPGQPNRPLTPAQRANMTTGNATAGASSRVGSSSSSSQWKPSGQLKEAPAASFDIGGSYRNAAKPKQELTATSQEEAAKEEGSTTKTSGQSLTQKFGQSGQPNRPLTPAQRAKITTGNTTAGASSRVGSSSSSSQWKPSGQLKEAPATSFDIGGSYRNAATSKQELTAAPKGEAVKGEALIAPSATTKTSGQSLTQRLGQSGQPNRPLTPTQRAKITAGNSTVGAPARPHSPAPSGQRKQVQGASKGEALTSPSAAAGATEVAPKSEGAFEVVYPDEQKESEDLTAVPKGEAVQGEALTPPSATAGAAEIAPKSEGTFDVTYSDEQKASQELTAAPNIGGAVKGEALTAPSAKTFQPAQPTAGSTQKDILGQSRADASQKAQTAILQSQYEQSFKTGQYKDLSPVQKDAIRADVEKFDNMSSDEKKAFLAAVPAASAAKGADAGKKGLSTKAKVGIAGAGAAGLAAVGGILGGVLGTQSPSDQSDSGSSSSSGNPGGVSGPAPVAVFATPGQ